MPGYDQEDPGSLAQLSMALTLGGDGTILRAARYVTQLNIPLLGVNMGKLGFLTEVAAPDLYPALLKIKGGIHPGKAEHAPADRMAGRKDDLQGPCPQ